MSDTAAALLDVRGLACRFGGLQAIAELDFSVREGEIKAIIGPNGAGKTTLFNMISGVIAPSAGHILLSGERLSTSSAGVWPRTTWHQPDFSEPADFQGNDGTRKCHGRRPHPLAMRHRAGALSLPRGPRGRSGNSPTASPAVGRLGLVGPRADEPAASLSFGESKLLEIARALAASPRLLLLDEPAAGVSHDAALRVGELIRALNRDGLTVLLVEHNMGLVMDISHSILVLDHGRKIAEGPPAAVRNDPAVLAAYLGEDDDA